MLERLFDRADAKSRPPWDCIKIDDPWSVNAATAAIAAAKAAEPPPAPTLSAAICAWFRVRGN